MFAVIKRIMITGLFAVLMIVDVVGGTSHAVVHGIVTDNAGRPVRGALVTAAAGDKSITQFSQPDGHYVLAIPATNYQLSVDAYGFGREARTIDSTKNDAADFQLKPVWDITQLSGAEIDNLLP